MVNEDTLNLLRECSSGAKMAVSSIDEVSGHVTNKNLRSLLAKSRQTHEALGGEIHQLLMKYHTAEKEPAAMAKSMSWLKTNMTMLVDESDAAIAGLMTDGCGMGIKALYQYFNQYTEADAASQALCRRLAAEEEDLIQKLRTYL